MEPETFLGSIKLGGSGSDWTSNNGNTSLTGNLILNGSANLSGLVFLFLTTTGSVNQVLISDGNGNLAWTDFSGNRVAIRLKKHFSNTAPLLTQT